MMTPELPQKLFYPVRLLMDPRVSALRHLRPAQRFQIMCLLGTMWTLVFCLSLGAWLHYGALLIGHALVAFGALITGITFHYAASARRVRQSASPKSH